MSKSRMQSTLPSVGLENSTTRIETQALFKTTASSAGLEQPSTQPLPVFTVQSRPLCVPPARQEPTPPEFLRTGIDGTSIAHTLGSVAHEAALMQIPRTVQVNDLRQTIADSRIEVAERDNLERLSQYLKQGKLKATHPLHGVPYAPDLQGVDHTEPGWILSESERENAFELLGVLVRTTTAGRTVITLQHTDAHQADALKTATRHRELGYFLDEAAQAISDQLGKPDLWARRLWQNMETAAALPVGHPNRLIVRDTVTGNIDPAGATRSRTVLVRRVDANAWLEAQGHTYRWNDGTAAPAEPPPKAATGTGKKWTPEKLATLAAYRAAHTMPETAAYFGISEQLIRRLLPSKKPKAKPFSGLINRS